MKAPDDKISYAIICNKFPIPQTRYATYDLAVKWAKLDQPNYRPFYIVKCTEHFEICKEVNENDKLS